MSDALGAELRAQATALGFDAVAIARAERLDRDREALRAWLRRDRHATMVWMARQPEKRSDPAELWPGCRSVVVLAANYWPGTLAADPPRGAAKVALYARGRDYHKVLGKRARALAAWLDERTGGRSRAFVDTGPVLERAWAERAGIGWIGKNTNLISRTLGSWLLLAEVLTDVALEPDAEPHQDFCGSCRACIDACPTTAIVDPGVVDSKRCISYWTIEHRGPVPAERRAGNGDWMFGCDVCQDVCPWNVSFAQIAEDDPFETRDDLRGLDPVDILQLDEATFRARYSGTSLMRAKWEGMRRNACIVLGNRREPATLGALGRALHDDDSVIRGHAAWAIGRIGGDAALELLQQGLRAEADPEIRGEIQAALRYAEGA